MQIVGLLSDNEESKLIKFVAVVAQTAMEIKELDKNGKSKS